MFQTEKLRYLHFAAFSISTLAVFHLIYEFIFSCYGKFNIALFP
jgi:hypothetical protein